MATITVKTITTSDLERRIGEDVGTQVWNVLTDEWFNGELIPGSRRVPLDHLRTRFGTPASRRTRPSSCIARAPIARPVEKPRRSWASSATRTSRHSKAGWSTGRVPDMT